MATRGFYPATVMRWGYEIGSDNTPGTRIVVGFGRITPVVAEATRLRRRFSTAAAPVPAPIARARGCAPAAWNFRLRRPGGRRLPVRRDLGLFPSRGFLHGREKVLADRRVVQPQRLPPHMQEQLQRLAVQSRRTVRQRGYLQRGVTAAVQSEPLKRRIQILRPRVEHEVLDHPQRLVQRALGDQVVPPRALRRDLQHEVRRLRLAPQQIRVAILVPARPHHHEYVGRHGLPRVALLVVHQHVAAHVHVRPPGEVSREDLDRIDHHVAMDRGFSHRLAVGAGILDDARRNGSVVHRQALRRRGCGSWGDGCRTMVA